MSQNELPPEEDDGDGVAEALADGLAEALAVGLDDWLAEGLDDELDEGVVDELGASDMRILLPAKGVALRQLRSEHYRTNLADCFRSHLCDEWD